MPSNPSPAARRAARSDGVEARHRLLYAALRLFAEKGFAKTSTREIAQAAGTNVAAIRYYFGDKAGLYAACFAEPLGGNAGDLIPFFEAPGLSLAESLHIFMTGYVEPLRRGEVVRQCMRLHMREMLEPTSQWLAELERDIKGPHEALVRILCRHLKLARADDDVHRLAFALAGLPLQLFVTLDAVDAIKPSLLRTPRNIDTWSDRLTRYALALVAAEADRRREAPARKPASRASTTRASAPSESKRT